MALKVGELYATADIRNQQFNAKLGNMQRMLGRGGALVGAAVAGTAAIGAAFSAVAADGIKQFKQLETGMSEVFTLLPDATNDMKRQMIDDLQEFKMEMGTTTEETVPALYDAISAGVPRENVFQFLETAQKAAKGGVTDLNTAVDGLTTVVNAYGKEIEDAEDVSDVLFTTVRTGKTTMDELGSSLSDVAPIAAAVGVDFQDIGAALATMTAQGVPTAEATTQLRQALNELSKEGTNAYDTFKNIAGEAFTDFIANGGNLQEAMVLMEQAAKNNNTAVQNMFSNIRGGQAALTLTGSGAETFANNLDSMADRAGATDDAFITMMDTSQSWQNRLTAAFEVVREKIGEELNPTFQDLVKLLVENVPKMVDKIDKIGGAFEDIKSEMDIVGGAFVILYEYMKTFVGAGVNGVKIFADALTVIKSAVDIVVSQIGYASVSMYLSFAKMIDKIIQKAKVLENIPGIGNIFGDMADNSTESIQKMEKDQEQFLRNAKRNTMDLERSINDTIESYLKFGEDGLEGVKNVVGAGFDLYDIINETDNNTQDYINTLDELRKKGIQAFTDTNEAAGGGNETETGGGDGGLNTVAKTEKEKQVVKDKWDSYTKWMKEYRKQQWMEAVNEREKEDQLEQEKWDQYTQWAIEYNKEKRQQAFNQKKKEEQLEQQKWDNYTTWAREQKQEEFAIMKEKLAREKELQQQKWDAYTKYAQKKKAEEEKMKEFQMERNKIIENSHKSTWDLLKTNVTDYVKDFKKKMATSNEAVMDFSTKAADSMVGFFNQASEGTKSFKEGMKDAIIMMISALQKQVLAQKIAGIATAWAQAPATFGASLAAIGPMVAKAAAAMAGLEAIKGGIRSFDGGGIVPGPKGAAQLAMVHGQEEVLTPSQRKQKGSGKGTANIIVNLDGRTIAKAIEQPLLDTITIKGGVTAR